MSKRKAPLVSYSSDSDAQPTANIRQASDAVELSGSAKKKRKLPKLPNSFSPPVPIDDPAQHQGRQRTTPHVDGQFAAHVYIPVSIDSESNLAFRKLLKKAVTMAKEEVSALHEFGQAYSIRSTTAPDMEKTTGTEPTELHISLSRPIYLRAHQREELKKVLKQVAKSASPFSASFASFIELTNDENTRLFLALEVGAGHNELQELSNALIPALESIRQHTFYPDPKFHASFAWALLDQTNSTASLRPPPEELAKPEFPKITALPEGLLSALQQTFGKALNGSAGRFEVSELKVRIGKEVTTWSLQG